MTRKLLQKLFIHPKVRDVCVDDNELLLIHAEILKDKKMLQSAFKVFYTDMINAADKFACKDGLEVEIGSGAGFFRTLKENIVTSDVRKGANIDIELDAQKMNLLNESVRCLYAINVFHHLPNPENFFQELIRVLKPNGCCILIEPHNGLLSSFIHKRLHKNEYFDMSMPDWNSLSIEGPLSGANQALADIILKRDFEIFNKKFGTDLEIVSISYERNAFRYLLSGGLNFRQPIPDFFTPVLAILERIISFCIKHWSMHQLIVIRKIDK